jgi:hypothetical protein
VASAETLALAPALAPPPAKRAAGTGGSRGLAPSGVSSWQSGIAFGPSDEWNGRRF